MPRLVNRNPRYCKHKASGQATVTIDGTTLYLGPYGTQASKSEYDRVIAEYLACGRRLPGSARTADLSVNELLVAFLRHAETYYRRPDGTPTREVGLFKDAMRPLKRLYGHTPASDFGPLALKAVRDEMVRAGWVRTNVNTQVGRLKRIFKWGVENELVAPSVFHGLQAVAGLRAGRSEAPESDPVQPVPQDHVDATLPFLSPTVRAMAELQLLTGMRPGGVVAMRGVDLDTIGVQTEAAGRLWVYTPAVHKTQYFGHKRVVYLGKRAQEVLGPFLKLDPAAFLFSPADADRARRDALHARRKTPLSCGNVPGSNRVRSPKRTPGECYDVPSYRRAIARACELADAWAKGGRVVGNDERVIPTWHPHQLRHNAATFLRKHYGLEAAQVILGHRSLSVTQVYAEKNVAAAMKVMAEVG
jgi:integrase